MMFYGFLFVNLIEIKLNYLNFTQELNENLDKNKECFKALCFN